MHQLWPKCGVLGGLGLYIGLMKLVNHLLKVKINA